MEDSQHLERCVFDMRELSAIPEGELTTSVSVPLSSVSLCPLSLCLSLPTVSVSVHSGPVSFKY